MSFLSKLTLVIPTYNRQRYALRNMHYWSRTTVSVHVLDGSAQPIPAEKMAGLTANVKYHHFPISLHERFGKAVDLVQTEYAALCGDDEFFLLDALQTCIQELEADEALVSCMGRCLAFQPDSNQIIGWPAYTEVTNYSVHQDDPIARMIHHMNPFIGSTIYSVIRTPVWKQAMSIMLRKLDYDMLPLSLDQYQFELAVCYQGKSKVIQNLMWLRSHENDGTYIGLTFHEWWADKKKADEREEFLAIMTSALAGSDARKQESVREGVKAACEALYEGLGGDRLGLYLTFSKRIPPALKASIKSILAVIGVKIHKPIEFTKKPLLLAAKDLEATGVRVDYEQLSQVVELIRQFHELPLHRT